MKERVGRTPQGWKRGDRRKGCKDLFGAMHAPTSVIAARLSIPVRGARTRDSCDWKRRLAK